MFVCAGAKFVYRIVGDDEMTKQNEKLKGNSGAEKVEVRLKLSLGQRSVICMCVNKKVNATSARACFVSEAVCPFVCVH